MKRTDQSLDPLSAVITAEFASTKYRGGIIAAVFAM